VGKARKDLKGRALRKGEIQRKSDLRYVYTYTDPIGRRRNIYANDLIELREKEQLLQKDQLDGLDSYVAGKATINETFERYMSTKYDLRDSTRSGYLYTYNHFVRDNFGRKKLIDVRYSDVLQYYFYLQTDKKLAVGTIDSIHSLLHSTFQLAVRDDIIRRNPTEDVMREFSKRSKEKRGVRHALTVEQQRALMDYVATHTVYYHWWPLLTILLGTGCRIGEVLGLRWQDLDFEKKMISINHAIVYYPSEETKGSALRVSLPKTEAGIRTIPMLDIVKDAFELIQEEQEETGPNEQEIDGMSGFVFRNRFGMVPNPQTVNQAFRRIQESYNAEEEVNAKREHREPVLLPRFSCHHLRHTFATRLCETESNLKVIQAVMGHRNVQTTMDIYADATDRKKMESFGALASRLDDIF
jgi:integrase